MHDWPALVRLHIDSLPLDPPRVADIVDELAQHVAQHHRDLLASGLSDADALAQALAPLRHRAQELAAEILASDKLRPVQPPPPSAGRGWTGVIMDVRYALRLLSRSPGFALLVVVTLALGIGANASVFGVLRAALLRPLPYARADRLVTIGDAGDDGRPGPVGFTTILDWRARLHSVEDLAIVRDWQPALAIDGELQQLNGMKVSANFFPMLGVHPEFGREFRAAEDTQNDWRVVMISHRLWRRAFNADPNVVDKAIVMNGRAYWLAGVMPASFEPLISEHFYKAADVWALLGYDETLPYACRSCQHLRVIGRLREGVPPNQAAGEVQTLQQQLQREHPSDYSATARTAVVPLNAELNRGLDRTVWMLMAAVGFVLLIACANVANLILARSDRRSRELALRVALGASRGRILRQMITEGLVLTTASAVVALGVAWVAMPALAHLSASPRVRLEGAHVDALVLLFSLGLAVATGVGFGVIPAFRAWRVNLRDGRLAGGRGTPRTSSLTRRALIGIEVALAIVLLIGAGLMMRSIAALVGVAPGFDPSHVLVVQTSFIGPSFAKNEVTLATQGAVLDRLRAIPGATVVAAAGQTPLDGNFDNYGFHIENRLRGKDGADDPSVERYSVTPDYAKALGIPLIRGRFIETTDTATTQAVLVVSERTAKALWPGEDPIGARVKIGGLDGPWRTIVGIVGDVRHASLAEAPPMQMYLPQTQFVDTGVAFVVRASGDPMALAAQARAAIRDAGRSVSISSVMSLDELAERSIGPRRFTMGLLVIFGLIALTLTSIGIYGVIACTVQERTREIGIRHALGASRGSLTRLIMGNGLVAVFIGVVAGLAVGYWSTRLLEPSLYETPSRDPATMAAAVVVLIVAAVVAHAIPLRRALRINPTVALRSE